MKTPILTKSKSTTNTIPGWEIWQNQRVTGWNMQKDEIIVEIEGKVVEKEDNIHD